MIGETKMQEIMRRYDELPENVQKALFATSTSDAIFEIGKKYGLIIEKMGELADETGLVMLGMTKPSEFIRNLERRLGIETVKAKEIAQDINQKVFSPIRDSLKKIHGITAPTEVGAPMKISSQQPTSMLIPPVKPVSPISPPTPPENLPVEITHSQKPISTFKSSLSAEHTVPKKIIMPEQPANIKVGEVAKEVEPKIEVKPLISGRIETKPSQHPLEPLKKVYAEVSEKKETKIQETNKLAEEKTKEIPDIFLKKIPVPPTKPSNFTNNDPYKEQI